MPDRTETAGYHPEDDVVSLIREVGCERLGFWDGCCCSSSSVRGVSVDISCGKGREQAVWVSSHHMDYNDKTSLRPVMDEVIRQLEDKSGRGGGFARYFAEWDR